MVSEYPLLPDTLTQTRHGSSSPFPEKENTIDVPQKAQDTEQDPHPTFPELSGVSTVVDDDDAGSDPDSVEEHEEETDEGEADEGEADEDEADDESSDHGTQVGTIIMPSDDCPFLLVILKTHSSTGNSFKVFSSAFATFLGDDQPLPR